MLSLGAYPKQKYPWLKVGLTADAVLKSMRLYDLEAVKAPQQVGTDKHGIIVKWFLPGVELTLARRLVYGQEHYCITAIDYG